MGRRLFLFLLFVTRNSVCVELAYPYLYPTHFSGIKVACIIFRESICLHTTFHLKWLIGEKVMDRYTKLLSDLILLGVISEGEDFLKYLLNT